MLEAFKQKILLSRYLSSGW